MTEENRIKYERLAATGKFTEDELARLRAGFEKPPRKYDHKKSDLHMETVGIVQKIEDKINDSYDGVITAESSWIPEGRDDDGNAYIYLNITRSEFLPVLTLDKKLKAKLEKAFKAADKVELNWQENKLYIKLVFEDIIKEGDPV